MKYLFLALCFWAQSATAQFLFKEKYKDCTTDSACYYCGDKIASYKSGGLVYKLQKWTERGGAKWMHTSGRIYFEIEIDATGHSCVRSIKDETHMADLKDELRRCINNIYDWQPAIKDNKRISSTVILSLYFLSNVSEIEFVSPEDIH